VGRLGLVDRSVLARYVAPALFLLAVTGVVLVIRSGLRSDSSGSSATATAAAAEGRSAPSHRRSTPPRPKRWYVIQSGDTLGAIASQLGTTVATLLRLNPGVEPTALRPGERLRVA
jgi:LysM repeat protein